MSQGLFHRLQGELAAREQSPGLCMSDLLAFAEPAGSLLSWMLRQGQVTLADAMTFLGQDEAHARQVLDDLVRKGFVREIERRGITTYRVRLAPKRGKTMPANLWKALEDKAEPEEEQGQ